MIDQRAQGVSFGFPFAVTRTGGIDVARGDARLQGKILQVLLTVPGERVNRPDFGCGLFNLVFEPDNAILAAALEFTVGQALTRWLGDEIAVDGVDVTSTDDMVVVEIAWVSKADLSAHAMRVQFR
jgi:phage baseplate assembly protein W